MKGRGIVVRDVVLGAEIGTKLQFVVRAGQLLLSKIDARNGAFGIVPSACDGSIITGNFWAFDVDSERLEPKFVDYLTKTPLFVDFCVRASEGTTNRLYLQEEAFLAQHVALPPLSEQHRIVTRIEQLAGKVHEASELRRVAAQHSAAVARAAAARAFARLSPRGQLGDVLRSSPRNGWSVRCDNLDGGTPVLALSAVTGFRYRASEFKRTSAPTAAHAHYWLQPGDLLITRSNTPELVGHAAIYDGSPSPCIYPDLMMRLDVDPTRADVRFVHHWLASPLARRFVTSKAKGTSPSMRKISQGVVSAIPFPTDTPLEEQRHIVEELDVLDSSLRALRQHQEASSTELNALLPSILDRAFSGGL